MGLIKPSQWTTGLCDCSEDCGNCCLTCCCPCITFGRNAEIIEKGATSCSSGSIIFYLLSCVGCSCLYSCGYRTKLRSQYSLQNKPCGDFLVHFFCTCCALCQEHRELKNRGYDPSIGWAENAKKMRAPAIFTGMFRNK